MVAWEGSRRRRRRRRYDIDDGDGDGDISSSGERGRRGTRRRREEGNLHDCMRTYYEKEEGKGDNVKVFDKGDDCQSEEKFSINCNVMVIHIHPCSAFAQIASQQINLQAILLAHPPNFMARWKNGILSQ